jgi:hypothetical protein
MKGTILRENNGRILGRLDEFWNNEDESYADHRETELRFPNYNKNLNSPVTVWNLNDKKN